MAIIKTTKGLTMHKLYKPSGAEVEVNDSSLEFALGLSWSKKKPVKKVEKKPAKKAD